MAASIVPKIGRRGLTLVLGVLWATGGKLHSLGTTTVTCAGLVYLLLPTIAVMSWAEIQKRIPWSTIIVLGVGISVDISLGTGTFTARQFAKTGIVITVAGYGLMLVFSLGWWKWLGWI